MTPTAVTNAQELPEFEGTWSLIRLEETHFEGDLRYVLARNEVHLLIRRNGIKLAEFGLGEAQTWRIRS
ncbi:hypothetical protein L596_014539 [Steinernema carpocapsae]|uniref:Uncharacterized protein n=1 Tax=Steinernema carpocapsae TaxID=34508 RepID=A0A4U5NC82_STECR|nr:hypothetical protein L596_014539 [Steinernema carpocapsae]